MQHEGNAPIRRPRAAGRTRGRPRRAAALLGLAALFAAGLSGAALTAPQEGDGPTAEDTRVLVEKWVQTRKLLSQERQDWGVGKELLTERVELVQREIDSIRARITDAQSEIAAADRKREELLAESERLAASGEALTETVQELEGGLRRILPSLPAPLADQVQPLTQRLPKGVPDEEVKQSLGQRFANVVGVMNEVDRFQRELTIASEVRTLPSGTTAEVAALYVGVGQGYYVTANGESAGYGRPGAPGEEWTWSPADDEASAAIARAIAILNDDEGPAFVRLPLRVQ